MNSARAVRQRLEYSIQILENARITLAPDCEKLESVREAYQAIGHIQRHLEKQKDAIPIV